MVGRKGTLTDLPDYYVTVAQDVLHYCHPRQGVWVDLGSGSGRLGLALAGSSASNILLVDPDIGALGKGLQNAGTSGLTERVTAIAALAESIPLLSESVDLVVSRGSIFFWQNPAQGLREVYRILRRGARAMIGGGLGTSYPEWARKEFFRRLRSSLRARGGEEALRTWDEARRLETLIAHANAAGIGSSLLMSTPPGKWLLFEKKGP